ncbi:predicted protein [Chaetoceros tenuissimus]|uniref:Uncharacterized protein n=1 Tax=Chaetoceros tenuissimus TaxID=426638 RepID=A0AAD3DC95_9STRA|nr:predicted protein [Chaetoceros tenuissimus]
MTSVPQDAPPIPSTSTTCWNQPSPDDLEKQIESLEQALKIQIQKRIEADKELSKIKATKSQPEPSTTAQTNSVPSGNIINAIHQLNDLNELITGFTSEVDGLDGDDSEDKMDRKDVLWILNEVSLRVIAVASGLDSVPQSCNDSKQDDVHRSTSQMSSMHDIDGDDEDDQVAENILMEQQVQDEMNVAKLQGQIAQLQEINQKLNQRIERGGLSTPTMSKSKTLNSNMAGLDIQQQYSTLQEKYTHLEHRHANILKEMQLELNEKNQLIRELKNGANANEVQVQIEQEIPVEIPMTPNPTRNNVPSQVNAENASTGHQPNLMSPLSPMSPFLTNSTHKDMQIASLQEEIDDRDAVIAELKMELDAYTVKKETKTMETDKIRIKYLESIITELESRLKSKHVVKSPARKMYRSNENVGDDDERKSTESVGCIGDNVSKPKSPSRQKYTSMLYNFNSFVDENIAPEALATSQMDDLELQIAELMVRLEDSELENKSLKEKLNQYQET